MKQSEFNNLILHQLVSLQANNYALRDMIVNFLANIPEYPSSDSEDWKERMRALIDQWSECQKSYETDLLASIRNQFDASLGSIEDLLKGIESEGDDPAK